MMVVGDLCVCGHYSQHHNTEGLTCYRLSKVENGKLIYCSCEKFSQANKETKQENGG